MVISTERPVPAGLNTLNYAPTYGTIFRISPSGTYTTLYRFVGHSTDGTVPKAPLVQGSDGNFYGTTSQGGTGTTCPGGCGTVFRISPSGTYTSLYSFTGYPDDGANPCAALIQGTDGNFYGTTFGIRGNAHGTIFRITPEGVETNLHFFFSTRNGSTAALVQGSDGYFYGATANAGSVFKISPDGDFTDLYQVGSDQFFIFGPAYNGLVLGSDGNFYGMTQLGGSNSGGGRGRGVSIQSQWQHYKPVFVY